MTAAGPIDPTRSPATGTAHLDAPRDPAPSDHPPLTRTARFAWWAVAVILVGVIVLVVYALTRDTTTQGVPRPAATSNDVIAELSTIPKATFDSVGVSAPATPLSAPSLLEGQPPLTSMGKPEVLFVGAEYCPFCASERWPLIVALSRFGHFTTLHNVQSAPQSVFPDVQTFTFVNAAYTSNYLVFTGVELYSDALNAGGAFTRIATLSPAQSTLVTRYGSAGEHGIGSGTYPFVDIGNRMVATTSGYSPGVLVGQAQATIAGSLARADLPTGQAIVASANQLTAGICQVTGQQPDTVCASKGVRAADLALGLS